MPITLNSRLGVLALGALAACADSAPVAPDSTPDAALRVTSVTTPSSGPWARIVEGRTGPASLYAIFTPRTWNGIASTAQAPFPFVPSGDVTDPSSVAAQTLVGSLFGALAFQVRGAGNLLELTHGHTPFDNSTTQYTLGAPLLPASVVSPLIAAANAGVARYSVDPAAQNYLQHHFTPSGRKATECPRSRRTASP